MKNVIIGRVLKPRGLKGELKIQILTNRVDIFKSLKSATIDNREYELKSSSVQGEFAYITIAGIETIDGAEKFRNKQIAVDRALFKLAPDEVLDVDIIGMTVFTESGKEVGIVDEVMVNGASVFFVIGDIMIANEDHIVIETDMKLRKITIADGAEEIEEIR